MRVQLLPKIADVRLKLGTLRKPGVIIGLVPTMGNLHAGHLDLVRRARLGATRTVVSVFVNPLQFDEAADFDSYPRPIDRDVDDCRELFSTRASASRGVLAWIVVSEPS